MPAKSFRFTQFSDLRLEGVGSMHALLNITEVDVKEGKKPDLSASLICNAAKAYGSGKIITWCTVINNIDYKKYTPDTKGKSFILSHDEILIGSSTFIIPHKKGVRPLIEVEAGYVLDTGYSGTIVPFPREISRKISLHNFK